MSLGPVILQSATIAKSDSFINTYCFFNLGNVKKICINIKKKKSHLLLLYVALFRVYDSPPPLSTGRFVCCLSTVVQSIAHPPTAPGMGSSQKRTLGVISPCYCEVARSISNSKGKKKKEIY